MSRQTLQMIVENNTCEKNAQLINKKWGIDAKTLSDEDKKKILHRTIHDNTDEENATLFRFYEETYPNWLSDMMVRVHANGRNEVGEEVSRIIPKKAVNKVQPRKSGRKDEKHIDDAAYLVLSPEDRRKKMVADGLTYEECTRLKARLRYLKNPEKYRELSRNFLRKKAEAKREATTYAEDDVSTASVGGSGIPSKKKLRHKPFQNSDGDIIPDDVLNDLIQIPTNKEVNDILHSFGMEKKEHRRLYDFLWQRRNPEKVRQQHKKISQN